MRHWLLHIVICNCGIMASPKILVHHPKALRIKHTILKVMYVFEVLTYVQAH